MQVQDVINLARQYRNDPNSKGRWSNVALTMFVDRAQQRGVRDLRWPESRFSFTTTPGQQEYDGMPSYINIRQVYLNGQIIVPVTLDTLEGSQIDLYDQGFGVMPGAQATGSGGPPGTQGAYTPAWNIQQPEAYPVANNWGLPAPIAEPWQQGQRPRYYMRGGRIGFVPAPANTSTCCIDAIIPPPKLQQLNDHLIFPDAWLDMVVWYTVAQMCYSDDSDRAQQSYLAAEQRYRQFMGEIRDTLREGMSSDSQMPKLLTNRTFYQLGNNRNPGPWIEYP